VLPAKWSGSDMLLSSRLESAGFVDKQVGCPAGWTWCASALCQAGFHSGAELGHRRGARRCGEDGRREGRRRNGASSPAQDEERRERRWSRTQAARRGCHTRPG
jgi:hypothetical protein